MVRNFQVALSGPCILCFVFGGVYNKWCCWCCFHVLSQFTLPARETSSAFQRFPSIPTKPEELHRFNEGPETPSGAWDPVKLLQFVRKATFPGNPCRYTTPPSSLTWLTLNCQPWRCISYSKNGDFPWLCWFSGGKKINGAPWKWMNVDPENRPPLKRKLIIFQASFFRAEDVTFGGECFYWKKTNVPGGPVLYIRFVFSPRAQYFPPIIHVSLYR